MRIARVLVVAVLGFCFLGIIPVNGFRLDRPQQRLGYAHRTRPCSSAPCRQSAEVALAAARAETTFVNRRATDAQSLPARNVAGYSCHDAGDVGHCYAITAATGASYGFLAADVSTVALNAQDQAFIDDEMWLIDAKCCWIEAGFMSNHTIATKNPLYFWAQGVGNHVVVSYFGGLDATQYGRPAHIQLDGNNGTFHALIVPPGSNAAFSSGDVTIRMSPNAVNLGQELSGTNGSHAPRALFTRIRVGALAPGRPPDSKFKITIASPPTGGWLVVPGQSREPVFYTECC